MLRQWNKLCDRRSGWAVRTFDPTLFKLPAPRRYRCRSISVSATALAVPEEKQSQPLVDLLADLFPMWGELSSDSQEILPSE